MTKFVGIPQGLTLLLTAAHPLFHHKPVRNAQSHHQPPDPQAHVSLAATQLASLNLTLLLLLVPSHRLAGEHELLHAGHCQR
jgi:hypothetical protein